MGMVSKGFGNVSLKDLTMERKRVEEFEKSHTRTSIHLSIQSWHHSSQNTYPSLKQKRAKHKGNPSIHQTYEKLYQTSTIRQQAYHHNKANILQTIIIYLSMFHQSET